MKKLLLVLIVVFLLIAPGIAQAHSDSKCEKSDASCTISQEDDRREHNRDRDSDDDDDRDHDDDDDDRGGRDRDNDDDDDDRDGRDHDKDDRDHHDDDDDGDDRDHDDDDDDDGDDRDRDDDNDDDDDDGDDRDRDDDDDDDDDGDDRDRDDDDDDGDDRDRDDDDDEDGEDRDRDDDEDDDGDEPDDDEGEDDDGNEPDDDEGNTDDDDGDKPDDDDDGDEPDDDDGEDDDDRDEPDDDEDDGDDDRDGKKGCRTIADGGIYTSGGDEITLGFDVWGYNYQARKFDGWYENADRQGAPVATGNIRFRMKWNEVYISNKDCDGDGLLDRHYGFKSYYGTKAWLTNTYKWSYVGDDGNQHMVHWFLKMTAQPYAGFDCASIGATPFNGAFCTVTNVYYDPYGGSQGMTALMNGLGFGGR